MSSSCFLEDTQLPVFTIKVQTQIFILYITGPGLVFIIDPEAFSTMPGLYLFYILQVQAWCL
jgi:hypothetical protein